MIHVALLIEMKYEKEMIKELIDSLNMEHNRNLNIKRVEAAKHVFVPLHRS